MDYDSEKSIESLEGVKFYDLTKQNNKQMINSQEQLVELVMELRELEKPLVCKLLR